MAKTVYVNSITGNNAWDGLSPTFVTGTNGPKRSILGARAATATGDLVLIAPGIYHEGPAYWNSVNDSYVLYRRDPYLPGRVIIDFEGRGDGQAGGFQGVPTQWVFPDYTFWTGFLDIHFRNPYQGDHAMLAARASALRVFHCCFYQRDGVAGSGMAISHYDGIGWGAGEFHNNTFYNMNWGLYGLVGKRRNNYFVSVSNVMYASGDRDYNAYPGNAEANGINTSTGANPGLTDPAADDLSLDPVTTPADWATFMTSGELGGQIGAVSNGAWYYNPAIPQLRYLSAAPTPAQGNPQLAWENEGPNGTNTYTDGTPGDIIEDGTTLEPIIDLATTPAATGGRIRSEVIDLGSTAPFLRSITFTGFQDLPGGAALDIDTTLPLQQEYRTSATSFAKGDVSPTWTAFATGANLNLSNQYVQFRITFRTDHTNA